MQGTQEERENLIMERKTEEGKGGLWEGRNWECEYELRKRKNSDCKMKDVKNNNNNNNSYIVVLRTTRVRRNIKEKGKKGKENYRNT